MECGFEALVKRFQGLKKFLMGVLFNKLWWTPEHQKILLFPSSLQPQIKPFLLTLKPLKSHIFFSTNLAIKKLIKPLLIPNTTLQPFLQQL